MLALILHYLANTTIWITSHHYKDGYAAKAIAEAAKRLKVAVIYGYYQDVHEWKLIIWLWSV